MSGQTEKGTIEETETETATPARHLVLCRVQAGEAVPAGDRAAELADVRQQLHPHHTLVTMLSHSGHTLVTLCCHTLVTLPVIVTAAAECRQSSHGTGGAASV